ncbi:helix-turn-helix domain-containing protein [uncultured Roseobacter sp.]|uniref:helix-turn-helix domain-containing protein n=1 Tax=uncultured Roseobacter sp. TaxID=114847 RepID=UPI00261C3B13|nr:AraC family transcriptional regulator [uncultured Roseobacter sp.]
MSTPRHAAPGKTFKCLADYYRNSEYAEFPQEHRTGGSLGLRMMHAKQEPFDLIGSALPDLVVVLSRMENISKLLFDHGDGEKCFSRNANGAAEVVNVSPLMVEERIFVSDSHEVITAALSGSIAHALLNQHGVSPSNYLRFVGNIVPDATVIRVMKTLWRETAGDTNYNSLYVDGLTLQLLSHLCDDHALSSVDNERTDNRIIRVIDYIEAHLADALSVTELGAIATMSAGHFSRCFKATTGEPVWTYVQRRRCERAKDLLLHSREPLAEISYRTGFANQAHMTTSLKDRYGATPGVIRASAK